MFYRVILDCRPSPASASKPFITVKFIEAAHEGEAGRLAAERTKALMKQKGFRDSEILSFGFEVDEIEPFDRKQAEFLVEQSFAYYSDD